MARYRTKPDFKKRVAAKILPLFCKRKSLLGSLKAAFSSTTLDVWCVFLGASSLNPITHPIQPPIHLSASLILPNNGKLTILHSGAVRQEFMTQALSFIHRRYFFNALKGEALHFSPKEVFSQFNTYSSDGKLMPCPYWSFDPGCLMAVVGVLSVMWSDVEATIPISASEAVAQQNRKSPVVVERRE